MKITREYGNWSARRRKVGNALLSYGDRVQESVFEVSIKNDVQLAELRTQLLARLESGDSLRFYHLCKSCRSQCKDEQGDTLLSFPAAIVI